ncbi:MAG: valine--tRNA ligase [Candidatus Paceibacterota bacterium]|jgi:valyl-tRNA synthetase
MDEKFLKPYSPKDVEKNIYQLWEKSGYFTPENLVKDKIIPENAPKFSIVMPPPNVTGVLHMGHALMLTIEDIIVRYKRMQGFKTLWLPGTDHAAIATQSKVEKEISKKEGKSRYDLGREELLKRVNQFAKESHDTIISQTKIMGSSADWSREAFTLDETRNRAVKTIFKKMYDDGLIYRGHRIVNWDPKGQTTISDDEIVYKEEKATWYTFKYGPFEIGTTRPETKFGDKYVVMHPDDQRYAKYKNGDTFELEWINGKTKATVVKDGVMDMETGTGVMTITPWHSAVDFDLAERYGLDKEQIIDKNGRMLPHTGEFAGMKIADARLKIVEKLREKGLLIKEEPYTLNLATAERTGGIIEPQIMNQWFVSVNKEFVLPESKIDGIKSGSKTTLKEIMRKVVSNGQIKIIPDYFEKTYFHWIDNLRDWCISRQIWYGHRIPVWYKDDKVFCDTEAPKEEGPASNNTDKTASGKWLQDEDTLDTWFSSGLWTFSTLGWPEKTKDLEVYHPTDLLETGYEILFFWIARMIMMTGYALGDIPFKTVYLHGTVRDGQGRKMSKSLGNGIDPIDVSEKYGADAGRMSLIYGTAAGTDSKISEDKIRGYKFFCNKLWNIARFVVSSGGIINENSSTNLIEADKIILDDLQKVVVDITKQIDDYRLHLAAENAYQYVWHTFADKIIEEAKPRLKSPDQVTVESTKFMLGKVLVTCLKLLHPFTPFVSEEIWQTMYGGSKGLLMVQKWPAK